MRPDRHLLAAALAHTVRADWAVGSVRKYLAEQYPHEPLERLAVAAVLVALDPDAKTPAALRHGGNRYWVRLGDDDGAPPQPPVARVLTDRTRGVPPPQNLREMVAAARAAARPDHAIHDQQEAPVPG